jgi:hypothetical protein
MRFYLTGNKEASDNLGEMAKSAPRFAAQALNRITELTLTDAVVQTPEEHGTLRGSAHVAQYATENDLSTRIVYGTEYALIVHESFARHNPPYGTGGNRKFLENAVNARSRTFVNDMVREMKHSQWLKAMVPSRHRR